MKKLQRKTYNVKEITIKKLDKINKDKLKIKTN
jgi:hypothetical protein